MKLWIALLVCGALSIVLFEMVRWMDQENDRAQLFSMMMSGR
jgi:hypothetical protein